MVLAAPIVQPLDDGGRAQAAVAAHQLHPVAAALQRRLRLPHRQLLPPLPHRVAHCGANVFPPNKTEGVVYRLSRQRDCKVLASLLVAEIPAIILFTVDEYIMVHTNHLIPLRSLFAEG